MDPRLLHYYRTELQFTKEMAAEFAAEYPKIAGRLGLDGFEVADPYVERLIEGFAFLTARVQLKLDAAFPRFTQHLLECVLPHYLAPLPSMAVVQFAPEPADPALLAGPVLPRGTVLRALLGKGDQTACEYRTAHAVRVWPLEITAAQYVGSARDLATLELPEVAGARAGVTLRLRPTGKAGWDKLPIHALPLFLVGPEDVPMHLYEQLLGNTLAVVIRPAAARRAFQEVIREGAVSAVGFADEESLLPPEPRSFEGYRLLREYFAFPERFRSVQLGGLDRAAARAAQVPQHRGGELEVVFVLDRADPRLQNNVDADRFRLFCTPAVNLFPKTCDRIHLEPGESDYQVVPDRTRPIDFEVHSVLSVTGHGTADDVEQEFRPLYGTDDFTRRGTGLRFFTIERQPRKLPESKHGGGPRSTYVGSEVYLSIVDGDRPPHDPDLKQLAVRALCSNRDLPMSMPVGQRDTDFTLDEGGAWVRSIRCLCGPTRPRPSVAQGETSWRLVNHLSLNHLSLVDADGRQGAAALRELLGLYGDLAERAVQKQIQGVRSIRSAPVIRRLPTSGPLAFGRGLRIELVCDENEFEGTGVWLLGAVLERFFARYVSINSFTETVVHTVERGEIAHWPPRIGNRPLL